MRADSTTKRLVCYFDMVTEERAERLAQLVKQRGAASISEVMRALIDEAAGVKARRKRPARRAVRSGLPRAGASRAG